MCKTLDAHQGILLGDVHIGRGVQLRHDVLWELSMLFAWGPWPTVWQRPQIAHEIVDFPAWGIGPWQRVMHRCAQPCEFALPRIPSGANSHRLEFQAGAMCARLAPRRCKGAPDWGARRRTCAPLGIPSGTQLHRSEFQAMSQQWGEEADDEQTLNMAIASRIARLPPSPDGATMSYPSLVAE